jgi:hypothetical protein
LKLRHIKGRKRLFPSAVEHFPALRFNRLKRKLKATRSSLLSLQDSNVSQSDIEKAIASQFDDENVAISVSTQGDVSLGSIYTFDSDIGTVGAFCEVNGADDSHAAVGVGELNVLDDSHAEIQMSDSYAENEVIDSLTESFRFSLTENVVGDFHAEIVGDYHSEIGIDNTHTDNGAGDFQAEMRAGDSHADLGDYHSEISIDNIHTEKGAGDFHAEVALGDTNPESGVCNSHARNGVDDCHSWYGIGGLCSEVKALDVSQSSGRENAEADMAVARSFQLEEEEKKIPQVPERQKLVANSSETKHHLFGRPHTPIVTRSMSKCLLRNKKRVSWHSADFEYPLHGHKLSSQRGSEGYKVSSSTSSRLKSYKDVFIRKKVTEKIVSKNDSKCPPGTSIALNHMVRRRFRSGGNFRGTPHKPRSRSVSCSEVAEKPFIFTDEFKGNMLPKILLQTTQKCNTEVVDKPANDINKVTLMRNSNDIVLDNPNNAINILTTVGNNGNTSTENHSSGDVEKQACCNNIITKVDKILTSNVLDHQVFNELCMNDIVKMKAKALAARKFRPASQIENLQRKMMRELQSLYKPVQS